MWQMRQTRRSVYEPLDNWKYTFYYLNNQEYLFHTMAATNYDELKQAITARYPAMSKQLQRIARFVLERPNDLALGTVAAIAAAAERAAVGDGPLCERPRFWRILGDAADLSRALGRSVRSSYRERIEHMRQSKRNGGARMVRPACCTSR